MHELTFEMIEDDVVGNAPYVVMLANATKNVSAHIHNHWVPTIPLNERNRAAVASIVADTLIEHTLWFLTSRDDLEVYHRPAVKTAKNQNSQRRTQNAEPKTQNQSQHETKIAPAAGFSGNLKFSVSSEIGRERARAP